MKGASLDKSERYITSDYNKNESENESKSETARSRSSSNPLPILRTQPR